MSYILDALKKSEQERKQGEVPDLTSVHMPQETESRSYTWLYMLVIFLLVTILAYVLGQLNSQPAVTVSTGSPAAAVPTQPQHEQSRTQAVAKPLVDAADRDHQAADTKRKPVADTRVSEEPKLMQQPVNRSNAQVDEQTRLAAIPHLSEMPPLVQQSIPQLKFAGHVYSTDAKQRSVIINGHFMSEGDTLIPGLTLKEITSKGVVFDYNGQLFRMDILQDWSFD